LNFPESCNFVWLDRRVWMEEGVKGMYGGMIPHLMRVVPNTAIIFFTYEHVSKWLEEYF
jgi:solute carrier family 25 protein 33/36